MKRWFTSLFFLVALVASVPAGTPFTENGMNKNVCPMKCCKKKSAKSTKTKVNDVAICRTLNCSTPSPINSSTSSQMNFVPNLVLIGAFSLFENLFETSSVRNAQPFFEKTTKLVNIPAKYIQHQSFLI